MEGESLQVVLVPWPVMGHVQIVDFAKLLVDRHQQLRTGSNLTVTVLLMKLPDHIDAVSSSFIDSLSTSSTNAAGPGVNFLQLPPTHPSPEWSTRTRGYFLHHLVQSQRSNVADYLEAHKRNTVALVTDMLCTCMIRVAEEFQIPSFVFFASPASFLGSMLHFQALHDEENRDVPGLKDSESDLTIPSFVGPVPPAVLSLVLVDRRQWLDRFLHYARDYRRAKGIIVNTFLELESHALGSFDRESAYGSAPVPPVYPVGPILNQTPLRPSSSEVLEWLEGQPPRSVVYVCFGSQGSLPEAQIGELALGLERSGARFLWSLRRRRSSPSEFPTDYPDHSGVLPDGFAERTRGRGRVVGWAPQVDVLSHESVGGFVTHCGWNSVLESVRCGVPMAAWPLHSEQQMNACQLARDLGLAVEITLSYYERGGDVVGAEDIARGVREVMEGESEVRRRVVEMREKSRLCVMEGGSSRAALDRLIQVMLSKS